MASDGKVLDKTDSIEQYTITHPNFSMSLLLISEPVGELHHIKLYSFVNKETFATCYSRKKQQMKSEDMGKLEQLFSYLTLV